MTEERLKEIKDSIDFQNKYFNAIQKECCFVDEELELYNEVIRLREIKHNAYEFVNNNTYEYSHGMGFKDKALSINATKFIDKLLDILKENNNG